MITKLLSKLFTNKEKQSIEPPYIIAILHPDKNHVYFRDLTYEDVVEVLTKANIRIPEDLEAKIKAIKAPYALYIGRTDDDENIYIYY